jgi:hypothetical protein
MSLSDCSEGNQLALFELYSFDTSSNSNSSSYKSVTNDSVASYKSYIKPVSTATESPNGWISFSKVGGTARGNNCYFRYSYRAKNIVKHKHIRGGNITRFKAIINAHKVANKIKLGWSSRKIIEFINKL